MADQQYTLPIIVIDGSFIVDYLGFLNDNHKFTWQANLVHAS